MLTKYVNKDVTQVPQVFIPYKEVLDVYHAGLQVPDEVTLMWCDDNYGYIRHFLQQKNVPVREETGYIIIYLIGGVRMIIFGWGLSILPWYTSKCLWHMSGVYRKCGY